MTVTDLVAAEWIKLRALRTNWIAYGATALAVIGFNGAIAYDAASHSKEQAADFIRGGTPLLAAFNTNAGLIMMLALGTLGALMIIGEYSTGSIRPTLAAVPARRLVMTAKVAVTTAATTAFGGLVAAVSFVVTQAILGDLGVPLSYPGAFQVVLASALLGPVCALTGMALGAVIRNTAATMTASAGVLVVVPIVLADNRHWSAIAAHATPFHAWLRLVTPNPVTQFPWTASGAWTVYAVWTVVAAALAIISLSWRDS